MRGLVAILRFCQWGFRVFRSRTAIYRSTRNSHVDGYGFDIHHVVDDGLMPGMGVGSG